MKKKKYIAAVWVPGHVSPAASLDPYKPEPIFFERTVDHGQPAPFYESSNYAALIVNLENGECRTYANMPYRLIVKTVGHITTEEFNTGVKFTINPSGNGQIYSYDLIGNDPRIIVHRRDKRLTPSNAVAIAKVQQGEFIELADENNTRLYFHEMYKYD